LQGDAHGVVIPGVNHQGRLQRRHPLVQGGGHRLAGKGQVHARHQGFAVLEVLDELRRLGQAVLDLARHAVAGGEHGSQAERVHGHGGLGAELEHVGTEVGRELAGGQAGNDLFGQVVQGGVGHGSAPD